MVKWYLILCILNGSTVLIPSPYIDKNSCDQAGKDWVNRITNQYYVCIQAPVSADKGYVCQPGASVCQVVK